MEQYICFLLAASLNSLKKLSASAGHCFCVLPKDVSAHGTSRLTKMAYSVTFRLRMKVRYFKVENHFSPSNEILSYSVSLKQLQHNDLQDMQSHRQKVMSKSVYTLKR